jgi:hypothetical protein
MRLALFLFLCLAGAACGQTACNSSTLWALCQLDADCAHLFKHDGAGGIADAMEMFGTYAANRRPVPNLPPGWSPTGQGINPLGDCSSSISSASVTSASLSQLGWLIRYRAFMAGTAGLGAKSSPYTTQVLTLPCLSYQATFTRQVYDPTTGEFYASCAEGHSCASDDSSGTPSDANSANVLSIVVSSSVLFLALVLLVYVIVAQKRTHTLLRELIDSKTVATGGEAPSLTLRTNPSLDLFTSTL